ncbi:hypothetical protein [Roseateles sp. P5_E7]
MRSTLWLAALLWTAIAAPASAQQAPDVAASAVPDTSALPPAMVRSLLDDALQQLKNSNVPEKTISAAVDEASGQALMLVIKGDGRGALEAMKPLAKFAPLKYFPSLRVQASLAAAYKQLGDTALADLHRTNAQLLGESLALGKSADAPIKVQHQVQIGDVMMLGGGKPKDIRFETAANGSRLLVLEFADAANRRYLELPAAATRSQPAVQRYAPLPQDGMPAEMRAAITDGGLMLERFLSAKDFNYMRLEHALRETVEAVDQLVMKRQSAQALARLQTLAEIRPLDEIPHVPLLSRLSFLQGDVGNHAEQQRLRLKLFGLQQAIGAKGDASSIETAIEVPFVTIEYDWLVDRKLRSERQSLVHQGGRSYDVLDVVDENGQQSKRYFDVTRLFALRMAGFGAKP